MTDRILGAIALGLCFVAGSATASNKQPVPGLQQPVKVVRDVDGIAHVQAKNLRDMFFMQGYIHAKDRLWQMDLSRRQPQGRLAEVLGEAALASDVQTRTIGFGRAAERSWAMIQADAAAGDKTSREAKEALEAYADGVNAFLDQASGNLPPEYGAVSITQVDPWRPVDSVAIGKLIAAGLSFDTNDIGNSIVLGTYQAVLGVEAGTALFFEDLYRSQPFDLASTVPDAGGSGPVNGKAKAAGAGQSPSAKPANMPQVDPRVIEMGRDFLERAKQSPMLRTIIENDTTARGSNNWGVTGENSATGNPIIANDPHLALNHPTTFYPMGIRSPGYAAVGNGFAGTPFVITGQNRWIAWGPTTNPMDVTDVFQDTVVPDAGSPSGLAIVLPDGSFAPIVPVPETYFVNADVSGDGVPDGIVVPVPPNPSIPAATLTVPARYDGVIISFDAAAGTALTVQYTGFGPTRELVAFYVWNRSRNLGDFQRGLSYFDVGSQNWAYADSRGNLGYFTSAEMPIRTDLEAGGPALGIPPYFIRVGTEPGHQWLAQQNAYPNQTTPYEILSPAEMPQVLNPVNGLLRQRQQRSGRHHAGQQPAKPAQAHGRHFLPEPGLCAGLPGRQHHRAGPARAVQRRQQAVGGGNGRYPGGCRAAGCGILRAQDHRSLRGRNHRALIRTWPRPPPIRGWPMPSLAFRPGLPWTIRPRPAYRKATTPKTSTAIRPAASTRMRSPPAWRPPSTACSGPVSFAELSMPPSMLFSRPATAWVRHRASPH